MVNFYKILFKVTKGNDKVDELVNVIFSSKYFNEYLVGKNNISFGSFSFNFSKYKLGATLDDSIKYLEKILNKKTSGEEISNIDITNADYIENYPIYLKDWVNGRKKLCNRFSYFLYLISLIPKRLSTLSSINVGDGYRHRITNKILGRCIEFLRDIIDRLNFILT